MEILLLLVTAVGVGGVFLQIHTGTKLQRASFLKELYTELSTDIDATTAFYAIEYDKFEYNDNFHGSDTERQIDRFLILLDVVCEMHNQGLLRWEEMRFFEHYLHRTANNPHIQEYLTFLNNFQKEIATEYRPFPALQNKLVKYKYSPLDSSAKLVTGESKNEI